MDIKEANRSKLDEILEKVLPLSHVFHIIDQPIKCARNFSGIGFKDTE
jgi:hypothetical protein